MPFVLARLCVKPAGFPAAAVSCVACTGAAPPVDWATAAPDAGMAAATAAPATRMAPRRVTLFG
jgi:hypothetical protein